MQVTIDRFENGFAIVEDESGAFFALDLALLPGAKEGDVVSITIDQSKTKEREQRIANLMDTLFDD